MVFWVRCQGIFEELSQAKIDETTWNILHWTDISINVATGFLNYLYCGIFDLYLNSFEDWQQAKSFGQKYGLVRWNSYVESLKDDCEQPIL